MTRPVGIRARPPGGKQRAHRRAGRDKIEACRARALIGRQGQAFGVGQQLDLDLHRHSPRFAKIRPSQATSRRPASSLSSLARLFRLGINDHMVFSSPPMTPAAGLTSLATITSQPLRVRFCRACSIRCSVSAAKPTTSGGRFSVRAPLSPEYRILNQSEKRRTSPPFLIFWSLSPSTRQSATAAAAMNMSQGNAASTAVAISRAVSTPMKPTPGGRRVRPAPISKSPRRPPPEPLWRWRSLACPKNGWPDSERDRSVRGRSGGDDDFSTGEAFGPSVRHVRALRQRA